MNRSLLTSWLLETKYTSSYLAAQRMNLATIANPASVLQVCERSQ